MDKTYDPCAVEPRIYRWWEEHGYFKPRPDGARPPFVIAMPLSVRDLPAFLNPDEHIPVPLGSTYEATWAVCPEPIRALVGRKRPRRGAITPASPLR